MDEERIAWLKKDNRRLGELLEEKSRLVEKYEVVIGNSKEKLVLLSEMNEKLRDDLDKVNSKLDTQENTTNHPNEKQNNTESIWREVEAMKFQIRSIEKGFTRQLYEKSDRLIA